MKVLALDPGIQNYAFCILTDQPDILTLGHLDNTMQSLKVSDLKSNICLYRWSIEQLLNTLDKDDIVVIERYQSRGYRGGARIELINIMIGIILGSPWGGNTLLVLPTTWKTFIKKYSTILLNLYERVKSPHIGDALCLGGYVLERFFNKAVLETLAEKSWTWKT